MTNALIAKTQDLCDQIERVDALDDLYEDIFTNTADNISFTGTDGSTSTIRTWVGVQAFLNSQTAADSFLNRLNGALTDNEMINDPLDADQMATENAHDKILVTNSLANGLELQYPTEILNRAIDLVDTTADRSDQHFGIEGTTVTANAAIGNNLLTVDATGVGIEVRPLTAALNTLIATEARQFGVGTENNEDIGNFNVVANGDGDGLDLVSFANQLRDNFALDDVPVDFSGAIADQQFLAADTVTDNSATVRGVRAADVFNPLLPTNGKLRSGTAAATTNTAAAGSIVTVNTDRNGFALQTLLAALNQHVFATGTGNQISSTNQNRVVTVTAGGLLGLTRQQDLSGGGDGGGGGADRGFYGFRRSGNVVEIFSGAGDYEVEDYDTYSINAVDAEWSINGNGRIQVTL